MGNECCTKRTRSSFTGSSKEMLTDYDIAIINKDPDQAAIINRESNQEKALRMKLCIWKSPLYKKRKLQIGSKNKDSSLVL
ncbi:unnamed protein product [Blepharisma stoltei]|uniref:Uncharacterized protein n=1 Tax=Blepharisma stoltei TaxID=1481888 RepID=A0AAU9J4C0_9CILI|nr:unnamed protein product [Blepharisma stoltei]